MIRILPYLALFLGCASPSLGVIDDDDAKAILFSRDIRPIFAENCFACHGPDKRVRKASLRLDLESIAKSPLESGVTAIVEYDQDASALIYRITNGDPDERMPPSETGKSLTHDQIEILRHWIEDGAKWQRHWAFEPVRRPDVPDRAPHARNEIDSYILARLASEGVTPSPEADRVTLIRRLSFDLTGLPPTPEEVDTYIADAAPDAHERLVDRLLASPRYGERMANLWMDAARYADTNGYHIDNERFMWRWRDWVIDAYNANMPFDQFTIEQLAGDLLPEPTPAQQIATGFNRNHSITFEGGIIPEEYQTEYVMDRVGTTSTVFLGLTMGCARCHEHKFDPISQEEFYKFYAFFNTISEQGSDGNTGNSAPTIMAPLAGQQEQWDDLQSRIEALAFMLEGPLPEVDQAQAQWEIDAAATAADLWTALQPDVLSSSGGSTLTLLDDASILAEGDNPPKDNYEIIVNTNSRNPPNITAIRLEAFTDDRLPETGPGRADNANFVLSTFELAIAAPDAPDAFEPVPFAAAIADFSQKNFPISATLDEDPETGWAVEGHARREPRTAAFVLAQPLNLAPGSRLRIRMSHESRFTQHSIGRFRLSVSGDSDLHAAMTPSTRGPWHIIGPFDAETGQIALETEYPPELSIDLDASYEVESLAWRSPDDLPDGAVHQLQGENCATYLYRTINAPAARKMNLSLGSDDAIKVWVNDQLIHNNPAARGVQPDQDFVTIDLAQGENAILLKIVNYSGGYGFYFDPRSDDAVEPPLGIARILETDASIRTEAHGKELREFYRAEHSPKWRQMRDQMTTLRTDETKLKKTIPTTMVMSEMDMSRETFILDRGQYDAPTIKVTPDTPRFLPPMDENSPKNRLGLARWIVDPSHPLTSRVAVNRLWQMLFGVGLVETSEDFGFQGQWPSHPKLLDWLAAEYIDSGWDTKYMIRLIVNSATYRQSSVTTEGHLAIDPTNTLLARTPRLRLTAEGIRDNALYVSGLLVEKIGGPSIKPYQPLDLWKEVAIDPDGSEYSAQVYVQDMGEELYRRSMYIFRKRSVPPPSLAIFDAPNREVCTVRRERTNTPLQALVLMNDPTYVEAARHLAQRLLNEAGPDADARAIRGFRLATARVPSAQERTVLVELFNEQLRQYQSNPEQAEKLLAVGDSPVDESLDRAELAAWTIVASVLLNLDETITRG